MSKVALISDIACASGGGVCTMLASFLTYHGPEDAQWAYLENKSPWDWSWTLEWRVQLRVEGLAQFCLQGPNRSAVWSPHWQTVYDLFKSMARMKRGNERGCLTLTFSVQHPAELLRNPQAVSLWCANHVGVNTWQAFRGIPGPWERFTSVYNCDYYLSEMKEAKLWLKGTLNTSQL